MALPTPFPATPLAAGAVSSRQVRDIYDAGDAGLVVASDRISAFDVVLSPGIPAKHVLTQLSNYWFETLSGVVANHLLMGGLPPPYDGWLRRTASTWVRQLNIVPVGVRGGHLIGSAGRVLGRRGVRILPAGLRMADHAGADLHASTKAAVGHDENISFDAVVPLSATTRRAAAIAHLGCQAPPRSPRRGIIIADTKFGSARRCAGPLWPTRH
jgi:phosphoribosylaminoimidazole-succinocarboxamide synthase